MMGRPVLIIGAGGHARVLIAALIASRREIVGILHPDPAMIGQRVNGVKIIGDDDAIRDYDSGTIELVNGIGSVSSPEKRREIFVRFKDMGYSFARVIHPTAIIAEDVQSGEGAQIMAGTVVQTGCVISDNSIVNTGAILDHDCTVGAHSHIAPGAVLSGAVTVGDMAHIGTSATVIQGIRIGPHAVVGAGSVVIDHIALGARVAGVPAREIVLR